MLKAPVGDPDRFGETAAINRGMLVKVFEKIGKAHALLTETQDAAIGASLPSGS